MDNCSSAKCDVLAIGRAERYSPNSVDKDAAVLEGVCRILRSKGMTVSTVSEDVFLEGGNGKGDGDAGSFADGGNKSYGIYVSMGRHAETLRFLRQRQAEDAVVVNNPDGVALCCRRKELNDRLREAGVPLPPDEGSHGYWLKRACGVAESKNDVRYAATHDEMVDLRREMAGEGIGDVLVQAHVEGDLVKFYGVSDEDFFRIYYPGDDGQWKFGDEQRNGKPSHYNFDIRRLHDTVEKAASTIGVGVYGGDAIVTADGNFVIIDFNDWPSFSRCRDEAAAAIAEHIHKNSVECEVLNEDV